jgi:hypothetical protein
MDGSRLLAYRSVQRSLDAMPSWLLDPHERERLRDTAEALLLTRAEDRDDAERLRRDAALALSLLVGQRRWDDASADRIWDAIAACGPPGAGSRGDRRRAGACVGSI